MENGSAPINIAARSIADPTFSPDYEAKLGRSPTRGTAQRQLDFDEPSAAPGQAPQVNGGKPRRHYSDRFIPRRSDELPDQYSLSVVNPNSSAETAEESAYSLILRSEILGFDSIGTENVELTPSGAAIIPPHNMLKYSSSPPRPAESPFSLSPVSAATQKLLASPRKPLRKIAKLPFKVLEAPSIEDDFYLNLVDWSSQNVVAVGLNSSVYLWNALSGQVSRLCELGQGLKVTSVAWMDRGTVIAVGASNGDIQLWDVGKGRKIRDFSGHKSRVGVMAWNGDALSSGSRDRMILHRDVRSGDVAMKFVGHKQEICGLRWSYDGLHLASGGNDNTLLVWDVANGGTPLHRLAEHTAAVKAIAWSPHQRALLASGGGTADRCIRHWNIMGSTPQRSILTTDTGSQVCNIAWSKNANELVSTHGYSQNQVIVWSYPGMNRVATLTGHSMRVLYLAVSPDGQTIVTGAGDETLRFWNVFPSAKNSSSSVDNISSFQARMEIR